jgi:4-amino-4-deoxy-L-arabinose transferase-like glycosyltransferase
MRLPHSGRLSAESPDLAGEDPIPGARRERRLVVLLLAGTLGLRLVGLGQPIVENYVGRQIPTAMVARGIERGSGFLHPRLETGPFPNWFLVEPPLYALAAAIVRGLTGLAPGPSGRVISALGTTLAAWGLYGLIRPREGRVVAALSVAAFAVFPITLRYGRAFQPDALMLGAIVAGLRCRDEAARTGGLAWKLSGLALLATGLALKVISAYVLIPLLFAIERPPRRRALAWASLCLLPAILWYFHAAQLLREGRGSLASADNQAIWLRAFVPRALLHGSTYVTALRFVVVRAFTPIGFVLASAGLVAIGREGRPGRFWMLWLGSALLALAVLAAKSHHEYYWLALAPLAALGVGKALSGLRDRLGWLPATAMGGAFVVLCGVQSSSTWKTPGEWRSLLPAAGELRRVVPADALVVAPEALLYYADRRGCRLESGRETSRRAAGEWRGTLADGGGPLALVEFYRSRGARYFADLTGPGSEPSRRLLHEAVRARYRVLVDRPGILIVELGPRRDADDAP